VVRPARPAKENSRSRTAARQRFVADYPDLLAEWHPTRNGALTPERAARGSTRKVWWRCATDPRHEWESRIQKRVLGARCPYCTGRNAEPLSVTHPKLAAEWHPTLNRGLLPREVVAGSERSVWWLCPVAPDHVWQRRIKLRVRGGPCPYCRNLAVSETNSVATDALLLGQWHPTKNGRNTPQRTRLNSNVPVWWKCAAGPDHEWRIAPRRRKDHGCPFCFGTRPSVTNGFGARHPELAREWHPRKNAGLDVMATPSKYPRPVWWRCLVHTRTSWQATIDSRLDGGGACPKCRARR